MANENYKNFENGVGIVPKTDPTSTKAGEMEVANVSSIPRLHFHDGTSNSPVVTRTSTDTLTNKTLTSPAINGTIGGDSTELNINKDLYFPKLLRGNWTNDSSTGTGTISLPPTIMVELTSASRTALSGIDATSAGIGQLVVLRNKTGATITITNDGATTNGILTGTNQDLSLSNDGVLWLVRNRADNRWSVIGGTGSGGANFLMNNYNATGSTTYTLSSPASSQNNMFVYIDGVYQERSTYSVSGTTLTFVIAPVVGSTIEVIYGQTIYSNIPVFNQTRTFSGNSVTTTFDLNSTPTSVLPGSTEAMNVFISGVYQHKQNYSISGSIVTFLTAPPTGTNNIQITWGSPISVGVPTTDSVSTASLQDNSVTTSKIADSNVTTSKIANSNVTNAKLADMTASTIKGRTGSTGAPQDLTAQQVRDITFQVPTVQRFTSGSGTYTPTSANVKYIIVELVGGGGAGGGSGAAGVAGTGTDGTSSTFGTTSPLLTAFGGVGGRKFDQGGAGGGGGASVVGATTLVAATGSAGQGGNTNSVNSQTGGIGGNSVFSGAGEGATGNRAGGNAASNSGSGGGGACTGTGTSFSGGGGGSGGYVRALISTVTTYSYSVGSGGTGSAGSGGFAGGAGGSGVIIVTEYYQ